MISALICLVAMLAVAGTLMAIGTKKISKTHSQQTLERLSPEYGRNRFIKGKRYECIDRKMGKPENGGSNPTDYNKYTLTGGEKVKYTTIAAILLFVVGYMFFKNMYISLFLCGFSPVYTVLKKKDLVRKRKNKLSQQFRDALFSISSSLSAGRAVEGAFKAALDDLRIMYPDEDAYIIRELEQINRKTAMNDTLESALRSFAGRADIEDITNFADVFGICRNTGGNLVEVIKNTSGMISQKMEIKNEIEILVAEQKFSQKILSIMPFGLLALIMTGSPEYIEPLYSTKGHAAMLVVLILLVVSYYLGYKITDIKI